MSSVWGMVTRQTKAGVLGPEHAIDRYAAMKLYTANAVRLVGEDDLLGALHPVNLADIVVFHSTRIRLRVPWMNFQNCAPALLWAAVKCNTIPKGCSSGRSELTAKVGKLERSTTNLLIRAGATYSMAPDRCCLLEDCNPR